MVDDSAPDGGARLSTCPWCSATYPGDPEACPSCGAALAAEPGTDATLPGLTAIDPQALSRRETTSRPRNRLLSWISGGYPEDEALTGEAEALARPPDEVRREMLRLELEAHVANLQAEADAIVAEAAAEGREVDLSAIQAAELAARATLAAEPPLAEPDADPTGAGPEAVPSNGNTDRGPEPA